MTNSLMDVMRMRKYTVYDRYTAVRLHYRTLNKNSVMSFPRNSVSDLQSHLSSLELRMSRETRLRHSLEDEIRQLRDENRRLQESERLRISLEVENRRLRDENLSAALQLRRFTEWFFQTMEPH